MLCTVRVADAPPSFLSFFLSGTIEEQGTFEELVAKGLDFADLLEKFVGGDDGKEGKNGKNGKNGRKEEATGASTSSSSSSGGGDGDAGGAAGGAGGGRVRSASIMDKAKATAEEKAEEKTRLRKDMTSGANDTKTALMREEERNTGAVGITVYIKYLRYAGGVALFLLSYLLFIVTAGNQLLSIYWVGMWSSDATPGINGSINGTIRITNGMISNGLHQDVHIPYSDQTFAFYLIGYAIVAVSLGFFTFIRTAFLAMMGVTASVKVHGALTERVMRAPTEFFDTTPIGTN